MKSNTKSSVTLPADELAMVKQLQKQLKLKTKVEVVRRGLYLLRDYSERRTLRHAYQEAARSLKQQTLLELSELDALSAEGLSE